MGELEGRVALVTGAGQGIGRATALRLAAEGARVAVNGREPHAKIDRVVAEVGGVAAIADVSDAGAVREMVREVRERLGEIEILVANHARMSMEGFSGRDPKRWWRQIDVNLTGTFHLVREVVPAMKRAGRGRIVIVSSEWGVTGWPQASGYAASKAGLIALGKTLGRELAPHGVGVNVVAPGVIDTPQLEVDAAAAGVSRAEIVERYAQEIPLRRVGRPEEVAATIAFLASERSSAFVGQVLQPNGGTTMAMA